MHPTLTAYLVRDRMTERLREAAEHRRATHTVRPARQAPRAGQASTREPLRLAPAHRSGSSD